MALVLGNTAAFFSWLRKGLNRGLSLAMSIINFNYSRPCLTRPVVKEILEAPINPANASPNFVWIPGGVRDLSPNKLDWRDFGNGSDNQYFD